MKKIVVLGSVIVVGLMSMVAFADNLQTPMLISAPLEIETTKLGTESIRGYVISYDNQTLTIEVEGKELPVTIYDADKMIEKDYPFIKARDFIEVSAELGEATYTLSEITAFSPLMDGGLIAPTSNSEILINYNDLLIKSDVKAQTIDGVMMIPLSATLKAMGYEVTWNGEQRTVEISKGPQWTTVKLGENSYFKNKMAPIALSKEAIAIDGRTMVPVEFFVEILGKNLNVTNQNITFNDSLISTISGIILELNYDETGDLAIVLAPSLDEVDVNHQTIIHTAKAYTFVQGEIAVGDQITVISSMAMTASIPPQTSGIIVYKN